MSVDLLRRVADFVAMLATPATPTEVAAALAQGPGAAFDATSSIILAARPPLLVSVAVHGHPSDEVRGFDGLAIDTDYPARRAFREARVVIEPVAGIEKRYAALGRPGARWRHTRARVPHGTSVSAPILCQGKAVGTYHLVCATTREWTAPDVSALNAISHALGPWLTHPASEVPVATADLRAILTDRQTRILAHVAAGLTTAGIGDELGCSESTVKAELSRAMRLLDADTRYDAAQRALALGMLGTSGATTR